MAFSQMQALSAATLNQKQEVSDGPDISSNSLSSCVPFEPIYSGQLVED